MISRHKIKKAFEEGNPCSDINDPNLPYDTSMQGYDYWESGFIKGVRFAEKELKELIIGFGTYCFGMSRNPNDSSLSFEELFKQFLKDKKDGERNKD